MEPTFDVTEGDSGKTGDWWNGCNGWNGGHIATEEGHFQGISRRGEAREVGV